MGNRFGRHGTSGATAADPEEQTPHSVGCDGPLLDVSCAEFWAVRQAIGHSPTSNVTNRARARMHARLSFDTFSTYADQSYIV